MSWGAKLKKPLLSRSHILQLLKWRKEKRTNSISDKRMIIFTDQIHFQVSTRQFQFVRRPKSRFTRYDLKYLCSKVQRGANSLSVSGAIWHTGFPILFRVNGMLTAEHYIEILGRKVIPLLTEDLLLQQDNANCHTSRVIQKFKNTNTIQYNNTIQKYKIHGGKGYRTSTRVACSFPKS